MIQRDTTDFKDFDFINDYTDTLNWLGQQEAFYRDLKHKLLSAKNNKDNFKEGDVLLCVKKMEFEEMLITDKIDLEGDWKQRHGGTYLLVLEDIEIETFYLNVHTLQFHRGKQTIDVYDESIKAIYELTWINK